MGNRLVPNNEVEFLQKARNLANTVSEDPARFGIPQADADALKDAAARFAAAYQAAFRGDCPRALREEKRLARAEAKRIFVRCVNLVRMNESADSTTRYIVGIKDRPKRLKSTACPIEAPRLRFVRALHENGATPVHELEFRAMNYAHSKPDGAVRMELFVDLIPPEEPIPRQPGVNHAGEQAGRPWYLRSFTRSPIRLTPPIARVPMRVVYWGRWADSVGNVGPFSATAAAWVEGVSCLPNTYAIPGREPLKILENARAAGWPDRDPIYRTALLEAQQESYHSGIAPALPAPELNEMPRLEGPAIGEAA